MAYIMNSCNPTCVDVLYDTVSEDLSLPNYFGMCLSASNGGSIDLGYINSTKYTGDLQYTPINMERWFNIILEDIQIGGISIEGFFFFFLLIFFCYYLFSLLFFMRKKYNFII